MLIRILYVYCSMNEKREIRKEILLLPSEFEQFTAAAKASGLPLTTWLVQAAREKLARHPAPPFHTGAGNIWIR